jgi:hypothetical protein
VVLRNVPLYVRENENLPILDRPGCFRPSDRLAGPDSHPLEIADFLRRTRFFGVREVTVLATIFMHVSGVIRSSLPSR